MKPNLTTLEGNLVDCNRADDIYVRMKESKEMSDTPRTDSVAKLDCITETMNYESVDALFARQLERELIAQSSRERALVEAVKDLYKQVETFCEREGEADFYTGKIKMALEAYPEDFK